MGMSDLAINSAFFWLIRIIVIFMVNKPDEMQANVQNDIHNYSINSFVEKIKR